MVNEKEIINFFKFMLEKYENYRKYRAENEIMRVKDLPTEYLEVYLNICQDFPNYLKEFIENEDFYFEYEVNGSRGIRENAPVIPWISIENKNSSNSRTNGYYIAYLFNKNKTGCYLTFLLATSEYKSGGSGERRYFLSKDFDKINEDAKILNSLCIESLPFDFSFFDEDSIELHCSESKCDLAKSYEKGVIFNKYYDFNHLPSEEILKNDLVKFIKFYELFELKNIYNKFIARKINLKNSLDISKRNRIFFGAPGTGKSHELNKQKDDLLDEFSDNYERVTFYPDYSYANFVGTYKPVSKKDKEENDIISYEYVAGPFLRILTRALKCPEEPFLLIIEEINRANVGAVFGDIFQLLDRDKNYCSEYPIDISREMKDYFKENEISEDKLPNCKLFIPKNMFIWATMNSADQGVFFIDTAFKRRWDFTYIDIDNHDEKIEDKEFKLKNEEKINWNNLRKSINSYLLGEKINEDKCLGPFFISDIVKYDSEITDEDFINSFKNKVLMYLYEDAGKSKRDYLFEGSKDENDFTYSKICKDFDDKGINIFNSKIIKEYNNIHDKNEK